jgi:hypothetical protein
MISRHKAHYMSGVGVISFGSFSFFCSRWTHQRQAPDQEDRNAR